MVYKSKVALGLIFTIVINLTTIVVNAEPLEEQLKEYNQKIEEDTAELSLYEEREEEIILAIQELDSKIESELYKQSELEEEIEVLDNKIHESNIKIQQYKEEIIDMESDKDVFVRSMYKYGKFSYLEFVFKSENVFSSVYNLYNYSVFVSSCRKNIEELNKTKELLSEEQITLENNKSQLEIFSEEVAESLENLNLMMETQESKLEELNSVQAYLIEKIEKEKEAAIEITAILEEQRIQVELERQREEEARREEELRKQEEEARRRAEEASKEESSSESETSNTREPNRGNYVESESSSSSNSSITSSGYTAEEVVAYASKFQGVHYVWGGTTPSGFDCSGLVQYCYAQFGYYLPRVSQDQQNFGVDVSLSELKTGDLVFWGRPATHVAFYIEGGYILHAPTTGDVVRIQVINLNNITSAKRIIN